ncbi:hypothetical protein [Azospirillum sp. sgz301742]
MAENEQTTKPTPADLQGKDQPGMLGDGTEEQNLNRPGDKGARITEDQLLTADQAKAEQVKQGGRQNKTEH